MLKTRTGSRFILAMLGAGFAAILLASLWQRFMHPSLVMHRFESSAGEERAAGAQFENSIGALMENVAKRPQDRKLLVRLVEALMANGQWAAAEYFAQRLLGMDTPDKENPQTLFLLGAINHNQGRHAQAAELFEKLLSRKEDPSVRYSLGILYLHFLKKPGEGIDQFKKALAAPELSSGLAGAIRDELAAAMKIHPEAEEKKAEAETATDTDASEAAGAGEDTENMQEKIPPAPSTGSDN